MTLPYTLTSTAPPGLACICLWTVGNECGYDADYTSDPSSFTIHRLLGIVSGVTTLLALARLLCTVVNVEVTDTAGTVTCGPGTSIALR